MFPAVDPDANNWYHYGTGRGVVTHAESTAGTYAWFRGFGTAGETRPSALNLSEKTVPCGRSFFSRPETFQVNTREP